MQLHRPAAPRGQNAVGGLYSTRTSTFAHGCGTFSRSLRAYPRASHPEEFLPKKTVQGVIPPLRRIGRLPPTTCDER